jgi:hypothetical protein
MWMRGRGGVDVDIHDDVKSVQDEKTTNISTS